MRDRSRFHLFGLAYFFIRSMKYHERMTLLAVILFIPLFTFSYLYISKNSEEIQHLQSKIKSSKLNTELLYFVKELQYYRGFSYTFKSKDELNDKFSHIGKKVYLHVNRVTAIYKELKTPSLARHWKKIRLELDTLIKNSLKKNSLKHFSSISRLIKQIHYLIMQNQAQFKTALHETLSLDTFERILFQEMPQMLENIAISRGLISHVLDKKNITTKELDIIQRNYYALQEKVAQISSLIVYSHLKDLSLPLDSANYHMFKHAFDDVRQKSFSLDSKAFFQKSTALIEEIYQLFDHSYISFKASLLTHYETKKQTYANLLLLLTVALSLALYVYIAIYILVQHHINKLKKGSARLSELNYNHIITINSHDELADIAQSINKLAHTLKFDIEIMDKYIPISKTDINGVITEVNHAFCQLTGYTKEELIGKTHSILRHPNNTDEQFRHLWETILKGETWDADLINKNKDGDDIWATLHIIPTHNDQGDIEGFTSLRRDITDKKKAMRLATIDNLTQIYNRQYFNQILERDMQKAKRYDYHFSLIMIDLDHFKDINDTYGHLQGDEILKRFTQLTSSMLRTTDTFARWGGEEFMILLPYTSLEQASNLAESLRSTVENYCKGSHKSTTISLGVTDFKAMDDKHELISRCDRFLYKAKEQGRNRVISQ